MHAAGGPPNPSHGIGANGGDLVPCPPVAGQAGGDGDGTCGHGERHVTYMPGAECRVCGLAPDGTCRPARSPAAMRHGAGGTTHGRGRPTRHGLARGTAALDGVMGRGREIAREHLAMMGLAPAGEGGAPEVVSHEPADQEEQLRLLREGTARETSLAGPAVLGPCPETGGRPEAGEGGHGEAGGDTG